MSNTRTLTKSLTGRTLLYIVTGLLIVLLVTSAFNYVMTQREVEKNLRFHMKDQIQRIGRNQQEILLLGGDITSKIRDVAHAELEAPPKYDINKRYNTIFMRFPDGAIRNRPEFGDGTRFSTLWAPKSTVDDELFRRTFVLFYDLCQEYGPIVRTRFLNLYFVTRSGANVGYDPETPNWVYDAAADYDPTDQNWVNYGWPENNPTRSTLITPPEHDPVPNLDIISIITPLDINGKYIGSVGFTLLYQNLVEAFGENNIPGSTQVLFRADGVLIAHSQYKQQILAANGSLTIQSMGDPELSMVYQITRTAGELPVAGYDANTNSYYAITRLQGADWFTANLVPASVVNLQASTAAQWVLWSGLLAFMLLAAMLAVILNRQIARPVTNLARVAKQVASGNLDVSLTAERDDEVGDLTNALNEMAEQLRLREDANQAEKKQLATALDATKTAETRFRVLLEYAADIILVLDENGITRFASRTIEKTIGYTVEDRIGQSGFNILHNDDLAAAKQAFSWVLNHPNEVINELEYRLQHKNGEWQYYSVSAINKLDDPTIRGIVVNAHNINDKKLYEEQMQQQRDALYHSEKLTAMGSLLAGVAHELNNPLSVVVGWALMLEAESKDEQSRHALEKLRSAAERCARIVKTFLAMAKQSKPKREVCNINDIIFLAVDITGHMVRSSGIEIVQNLDDKLPDIDADPDQLHQVFVNLLVNAQQAMSTWSGDRRIYIETDHDTVHRMVKICFRDTGPGIPENMRDRIFDPFYTTKPSGTGIGLSVSRSLVQSNNGEFTLDDGSATGAAFLLTFPVVNHIEVEEKKSIDSLHRSKAACNILVVDDEQDICEVISQILSNNGHKVFATTDAGQALRLLETESIDMIISDVRMPGMSGPDLYRVVKNVAPRFSRKILFITGDSLSSDVVAFFRDNACPYMEKPLHPGELISMVEKLSYASEL